jgi:hypothetical protein
MAARSSRAHNCASQRLAAGRIKSRAKARPFQVHLRRRSASALNRDPPYLTGAAQAGIDGGDRFTTRAHRPVERVLRRRDAIERYGDACVGVDAAVTLRRRRPPRKRSPSRRGRRDRKRTWQRRPCVPLPRGTCTSTSRRDTAARRAAPPLPATPQRARGARASRQYPTYRLAVVSRPR